MLIFPACSNALEDPWEEPSESMFTRSVSPEKVGGHSHRPAWSRLPWFAGRLLQRAERR